jgi:hypothetical protein
MDPAVVRRKANRRIEIRHGLLALLLRHAHHAAHQENVLGRGRAAGLGVEQGQRFVEFTLAEESCSLRDGGRARRALLLGR